MSQLCFQDHVWEGVCRGDTRGAPRLTLCLPWDEGGDRGGASTLQQGAHFPLADGKGKGSAGKQQARGPRPSRENDRRQWEVQS